MNTVLYSEVKDILTSKEKFHIELGLERVSKVLEAFDNPHLKIKTIHVAGTNGKGSVCVMLSNILKEAGYKIGLYTSPHILKYNERIKINSKDISDEDLNETTHRVLFKAKEIDIYLTEFEILTVSAFLYFAKKNVDAAVLETGLGGRLDATNVTMPILSVITSINLDHIERLGDTIEKIANEKAGIIKAKRPVIVSTQNLGKEIIEKKAKTLSSPVIFAKDSSKSFFDGEYSNIILNEKTFKISLLGKYQEKNLPLVIEAVEFLNQNAKFKIKNEHLEKALTKTHWPARMQFLKEYNTIIDGAHNLDGAKALRSTIDEYFPGQKITWIYASLKNKDFANITKELFKKDDEIFVNTSFSANSASFEEIEKIIYPQRPILLNKKEEIVNLIKSNKDKLLIVVGSLYFAGFVEESLF